MDILPTPGVAATRFNCHVAFNVAYWKSFSQVAPCIYVGSLDIPGPCPLQGACTCRLTESHRHNHKVQSEVQCVRGEEMRFIRDGNLALHKRISHLTPKIIIEKRPWNRPWVKSHLHLVGPGLSHVSCIARSSCRTCVGILRRWEPMWQKLITQIMKLLWHVKELHQLI
jgi:hypothetical protein